VRGRGRGGGCAAPEGPFVGGRWGEVDAAVVDDCGASS